MIEFQTALDAALPPYAIDAAGFGLYGKPGTPDRKMTSKKLTVDAELEKLQRETFDYFLH